MDCASEESETRRGLDGVDGIRSLSFRLGERSLRIDAAPAVTEQAVSGVIVEGRSAINQAPVTGESIPVDKGPGDAVFAGTINPTATFSMRVTAVSTNSTLSRIIHAVEQAQASRAPTQRFVDRFAAIYTLAVFVLALAVAREYLSVPASIGFIALMGRGIGFVDVHLLGVISMAVIGLAYAGRTWGLGTWWESRGIVKKNPVLR